MHDYTITWQIDMYAKTPREAAQEALKVMRDTKSMALVFDVADEKGNLTRVDLMMEETDED